MAAGDTWLNAFVGAVVSVLLSFVPLSPVLGGGVAGYLQEGDRRDCTRVGALSGLLAAVPLVLLFLAFGSFLLAAGPGQTAAFLLVLAVVVGLFVGYGVLLGAVGGYVAAYLRDEGHL